MRSLPTRERGLKFIFCGRKLEIALVAPHAGAWIEIPSGCLASPFSSSLPTRERGLKFITPCIFPEDILVAPHAGAWIEIQKNYPHMDKIWESLPTRERGLKLYHMMSGLNLKRSLPTRERGLKYFLIFMPCATRVVAPHAGAWIEIQTFTRSKV